MPYSVFAGVFKHPGTDLMGSSLSALLLNSQCKQVKNIHQDTWTIEETEASQDSYKNQLTGQIYRFGKKTMGEVSFNFTIGQYDYKTKAELMGGVATDTSWKRARGAVSIYMALVALTEDNQYVVLPYANIKAREASTDGAVGIGVIGTAVEPEVEPLSSEYWFDFSEVVASGSSNAPSNIQYYKTPDTAPMSGKSYYIYSDGIYVAVDDPVEADMNNYYEMVIYAKTSDVTIDENKTYYIINGNQYTEVSSPNAANIGSYYEVIPAVIDITIPIG